MHKFFCMSFAPIASTLSIILLTLFVSACGDSGSNMSETQNVGQEVTDVVIIHAPALLEVEAECDANVPVGLTDDMQSAINLAETRYTDLLERIANDQTSQEYTDYTDINGNWELANATRWTSGFLPGTLWYLFSLTDNQSWQVAAQTSTENLQSIATATDNDTGFQIYSSYGIGRQMLGGVWTEADISIQEAADTLMAERYNPDVGAFRAWPQSEDDPYQITSNNAFEVNVDMIMNMEVILAAVQYSGNDAQMVAAISHGDITWDNLMRPDFSSYHVAGFNADGSLSYTRTHQGWHEDSTWSRGQAWAVYGYAMLYRYTQLPRMLERAQQSYQFFKQAAFSQEASWVPYADFDAAIDLRNPLDSSAAAIVASAAIELYQLTENTLYLSDAHDILNTLTADYLSEGTDFESLLIAASEQYVREDDDSTPNSAGYEIGASFGDFYFLESLYRLKNTTAPVCN